MHVKMKQYLGLLCVGVLLVMGCGPQLPPEAEVRDHLVGSYCSKDSRHRLELTSEGRYFNKRTKKNPFGLRDLPEDCEGNFKLVEGEKTWTLVFEKSDKKSNPMVNNCFGEVVVYELEKGYLVGDSIVQLSDLFDGHPVSNANCGKDL